MQQSSTPLDNGHVFPSTMVDDALRECDDGIMCREIHIVRTLHNVRIRWSVHTI